MKIYVASSWRNERYPAIIKMLKSNGYDVYDFRNPEPGYHGFHWSEIDIDWLYWSNEEYRKSLNHPVAEKGFNSDFKAMQESDVFLGVMPFGRSASLEMGYAAGQGKTTILLLSDAEPELMVKMLIYLCVDMDEVLHILRGLK